jgi:uncharacterized protein YndB with AHSA1/START domain
MAITSSQKTVDAKSDLVLTRTLNAPRELVFNAWVDPVHFAKWWSPKGFTNKVRTLDARPEGVIDVDMIGPDGIPFLMGGTFHEVVPPEKVVFTTRGFHKPSGEWDLEVLNTVTFVEEGGKTVLTLDVRVLKSTPELAGPLAGMGEGWNQSLDKLEELVATN